MTRHSESIIDVKSLTRSNFRKRIFFDMSLPSCFATSLLPDVPINYSSSFVSAGRLNTTLYVNKAFTGSPD